MINYIIIGIISAAVLVLTPLYVTAQKNGACPKSLTLKMICACGYIAVGLISVRVAGGVSRFSFFMLLALACSFIGDFFLHLWKPEWIKALGFLGFLSAHFMFITAFFTAIRSIDPAASFFVPAQLIFILAFDIFFVLFSSKTGMNLKGLLKIPVFIYATVITTMLCKAFEFGILSAANGAAHGKAILVIASLGAVYFVASDFTISMLMFNEKHKKNFPLKLFNMFTYFLAELLLACLIMFG